MTKIKPFLLILFRYLILSFHRDHFFFCVALKNFTVFHFYPLSRAFVHYYKTFSEKNVSYILCELNVRTTVVGLFVSL